MSHHLTARPMRLPPPTKHQLALMIWLAVFPTLSAAAAAGDRRGFTRILLGNTLTIAALTTAAAVALMLLGRFVIELFLRGDAFTQEAADRTYIVLVVIALAIPFESVTHLLSRAIFGERRARQRR